jgi:hypothetical protein
MLTNCLADVFVKLLFLIGLKIGTGSDRQLCLVVLLPKNSLFRKSVGLSWSSEVSCFSHPPTIRVPCEFHTHGWAYTTLPPALAPGQARDHDTHARPAPRTPSGDQSHVQPARPLPALTRRTRPVRSSTPASTRLYPPVTPWSLFTTHSYAPTARTGLAGPIPFHLKLPHT